MGFSLIFMRVQAEARADADRAGLASFLRQRALEVAPSDDGVHHLTGPGGDLRFDGEWTDLHLDALDQEEPVTGGIWHATLGREECAFIYDLCVAGRMLILNPQDSPTFVVPGRTHIPEEIPGDVESDQIAWVDSADELKEALSGDFEQFVGYRDQVVAGADYAGNSQQLSSAPPLTARPLAPHQEDSLSGSAGPARAHASGSSGPCRADGKIRRVVRQWADRVRWRRPSGDDSTISGEDENGDLSESADPREDTALHRAAEELSPGSVQQQLDAGADPDARTLMGWTPLDLVAFRTEYWHAAQGLATGRVLLAAAETKTIAPDAAAHLRREFRDARRAHERGELNDETFRAIHELLSVLSVPEPVVVRPLPPGESITVTSQGWKAQFSELWQLLVPEYHAAESVQGEVIRIAGRVGHEILNNGGGNWDDDFEAMLDTFMAFTTQNEPLPPTEHNKVEQAREALRGGQFSEEDIDEITRASVAWVLRNPDWIPVSPPPYER